MTRKIVVASAKIPRLNIGPEYRCQPPIGRATHRPEGIQGHAR
jgi:hypothetical protein